MIVKLSGLLVHFKPDDKLHRVHYDQGRINEPNEVTEGRNSRAPGLAAHTLGKEKARLRPPPWVPFCKSPFCKKPC